MANPKQPRRSASRAPRTKATDSSAEPMVAPEATAPEQAPESAPVVEQATPPVALEATPSTGPTIIAPMEQAMPAHEESRPGALADDTRAEHTARSLAGERAAMNARNAGIVGAIALLVVVAGLLAYSRLARVAPSTAAPAQQAPAAQTNPTPAPATGLTPQPGGAIVGGTACSVIAGLPIYPNATCVEQDTDQGDGVIKLKNSYTTTASTSEVGRFYESAFAQHGWTLQAFQYDASLGQRSLKIEVETEQAPSGLVTKIKLTEKGAPAAATACGAIAGLPAHPSATCVKFDSSQDDGVIKNENTYTLPASAEEVRRFYEGALAQNGWAGQEFQYDVTQGARRLKIAIDAQSEQNSAVTGFKIEEG